MKETFSSQIYTNLDVSVPDFMIDRYNKIHHRMYNDALMKYVKKHATGNIEDYMASHKFSEVINSKTFYEPSSVYVISNQYPYERELVDLAPYWDDFFFNTRHQLGSEYFIESKDYIKGEYNAYSKFFDKGKKIKFNTIIE